MYYQTANPHGGAEESAAGGVPLPDFSVNTNPLGTPEAVLTAARAALERADRYPDPCCRALTRAIAAAEGVPEAWVLCGNGASELIYAYCAAVKPVRAAEASPTFSEYAAALSLHGTAVHRYPLSPERDFLPDEGVLSFLAEVQPDAVFLCHPNNPTGRLFPAPLREKLLIYSREHAVRLFVDECFLDLSPEGRGQGLERFLGDFPQLFLLKAFTKTYGMAGLRLGYGLCADEALLRRIAAYTPPWNVSTPAQAAGIAALRDGGTLLDRSRALIAAERERMRAELAALGLQVYPSEANFLLFRGPEGLNDGLRRYGLAVRGCGNFPGLGRDWYRTAVRRPEENDFLLSALRTLCGKE